MLIKLVCQLIVFVGYCSPLFSWSYTSLKRFQPRMNIGDDVSLTAPERVARAVSFYSKAIPVFTSYKLLESTLKFKREVLKEQISEEDEEKQWNELHDWGSDTITEIINELKGYYVKTGQIISTRVDIFPEQYTSKLSVMQDALDPVPTDIIKEIVREELLDGGELSDLFIEFDEVPLGSASIAQVHRARLQDGRIVAVKVQRPGIGPKLLGDISNLKSFAKIVTSSLPIDYYKVFCEVEKTLKFELDFLYEAQATQKIAAAVAHSPNNQPRTPAVIVPLPILGLVSRKVMVMEYVDGTALSKLSKEMSDRGIVIGSPESQLFGRKLLSALTDAYASMIFGSGIIHGDPHPGNIFVLPDGEIALLDCGQVKVLNAKQRIILAQLVVLVNDWERENAINPNSLKTKLLESELADKVRSNGVTFREGAGDDCAAAVAILLFGNSNTILPGGYKGEEISASSPIASVLEFPQELVLLGRATVMIRGIANRLGINWGLSDRWTPVAQQSLLIVEPFEKLPVWSVSIPTIAKVGSVMNRFQSSSSSSTKRSSKQVTTRDVLTSLGDSLKVIRVIKRIL